MTATGHSRDTPGQTPNPTNIEESLHHILNQGTLARVRLLSKKPLPARQAPQARFALTHPVLVAIASGAAISLWTTVIVKDWRAVVASAVLVSCAQGYLWSPWGWLHRRERRLYDENGDRRSSTSTPD